MVVKLVTVWWGQARRDRVMRHVGRRETRRTELPVVGKRRVEVQVKLRGRLHVGVGSSGVGARTVDTKSLRIIIFVLLLTSFAQTVRGLTVILLVVVML